VWHCATGELNSSVFLRATIAQVILNPCLLADRSSRFSFFRVKGMNVQARLHHFSYLLISIYTHTHTYDFLIGIPNSGNTIRDCVTFDCSRGVGLGELT
jgi:hypothetical protein